MCCVQMNHNTGWWRLCTLTFKMSRHILSTCFFTSHWRMWFWRRYFFDKNCIYQTRQGLPVSHLLIFFSLYFNFCFLVFVILEEARLYYKMYYIWFRICCFCCTHLNTDILKFFFVMKYDTEKKRGLLCLSSFFTF